MIRTLTMMIIMIRRMMMMITMMRTIIITIIIIRALQEKRVLHERSERGVSGDGGVSPSLLCGVSIDQMLFKDFLFKQIYIFSFKFKAFLEA